MTGKTRTAILIAGIAVSLTVIAIKLIETSHPMPPDFGCPTAGTTTERHLDLWALELRITEHPTEGTCIEIGPTRGGVLIAGFALALAFVAGMWAGTHNERRRHVRSASAAGAAASSEQ